MEHVALEVVGGKSAHELNVVIQAKTDLGVVTVGVLAPGRVGSKVSRPVPVGSAVAEGTRPRPL